MLPLTSNNWTQDELDAIHDTIKSGLLTMGEKVASFERAFAEYHSVDCSAMVNSGSSANLVAIAALIYSNNYNLNPGDEVIVPCIGWATTYYPLHQYGLTMRFVDIDSKTLNYDLNILESAITPKTKMILVVNILGNPNNLLEIRELCDKHNLIMFEDNCESFGAEYKGKMAGTWGHIGTFSTYFSHHLNTIEGGMVLSNDLDLNNIIKSLRSHGWDRGIDLSIKKIEHNIGFSKNFDFYYPGYNLRPMEISAAVGIIQLKKADQLINARRKNAEKIKNIVDNISHVSLQKENGSSSWFSFVLVVDNNDYFTRSELIQLLEASGIETRPVVSGNFLNQPVLKYMNYSIYEKTMNADLIHNNGFYIGNHSYDISEELNVFKKICESISK